MKLSDIYTDIHFDLWIKPTEGEPPLRTGIGHIVSGGTGHSYRLRLAENQWTILLKDEIAGKDLDFHLKRGCAQLTEVRQIAKDRSALITVKFFNGSVIEMGALEIGIDEHIKETAVQNGLHFDTVEELGILLTEKCRIKTGAHSYFVLMGALPAKSDFDSASPHENRAFCLYGDRVRLPIEKRDKNKTDSFFFATKAIFKENRSPDGCLQLARGTLNFTDYTKTGAIRSLAAAAMEELTKDADSYLKQWDAYGAAEGELLLAKAKAVGKISYTHTEKIKKGVRFFVSHVPEQLKDGDSIELTTEEPPYLHDPNMTWDAYSALLAESFAEKKATAKSTASAVRPTDSVLYAPIIDLSTTHIDLDLPDIPDRRLFLILSINGDKIQIERRMQARTAILEGRCANPLLGLIIEEDGVLPEVQRTTKLKPLTAFVKEKIFKNEPTPRQIEAIDIALNTPDIALIQGPPGTGKTTIITAIIERLNEEYDKTQPIRGKILVSGFQHDAVENIISRLSVNALPAVKFGGRSGAAAGTDASSEKINQWCTALADTLRKKNPHITQSEEQLRLAELFATYALCPSQSNTEHLIDTILKLPYALISKKIADQAAAIKKSMQGENLRGQNTVLKYVRALRITETAFRDDGPVRAIDLLDKIEGQCSTQEITLLEKAGMWRPDYPLDFLPALQELKQRLLQRFIPAPVFRREKPREDVLALCAEVSRRLEEKRNCTAKKDIVLAEFLHELEQNPDGIRAAIEDYNFVFAATTQQSAGRDIVRSKTKYGNLAQKSQAVIYDTVIIDEAARTSPRDLLIPMAQAEKRIILVGDHRQLPHIIDENIAAALERADSDTGSAPTDFVKKSMFEYLFTRLQKLEQRDGIRRTVTLDAQYRTHPLLGTFASDNFYKSKNPKESYRSPLPATLFQHKLEGIESKAAVWIDVPYTAGSEQKEQSGSRKRPAEAAALAKYVSKWIRSQAGQGLSFGIISFYKAQVYAVYEALQEYAITERNHDGVWQVCDAYRFLENGEERLRIGTVDAFQGMEFDVVVLSIVRSQNPEQLPPYIQKELDSIKKQQKLFGHLMSDNRLCVSLTRQKKVLVVVGNALFAQYQLTAAAVPALYNFYHLCRAKGIIL